MLYIGLDPGQSGGIAVINAAFATPQVVKAFKMPETESDVLALLRQFGPGNHAMIERVWSSPQMGVVSAFKFGRGVGVLHMALIAAGIPFDEVTPQKWQKAMGCLSPRGTARVEFGSKDKNITKRRAQALFPTVKVTHAIADALLIAEFARRFHSGAQLTPRAPQGAQDGEEDEARETEGRNDEESEAPGRAEEAAPEGAAGHGRSRHRGDRTRGARLR